MDTTVEVIEVKQVVSVGAGDIVVTQETTVQIIETVAPAGHVSFERIYPSRIAFGGASWGLPGWSELLDVIAVRDGFTLANDILLATPFYVAERSTFDRIGLRASIGIGPVFARLGVYNRKDGEPGDLLLDAGTVTGFTGLKEIIISLTLERGWYYTAIVSNSALAGDIDSITSVDPLTVGVPLTGQAADQQVVAEGLIPYATGQATAESGGLPDPFPAVTNLGSINIFPAVPRLRRSA
jgi:hypothetical protein